MKTISAIGIFVGMIFGAGIFALPYSISQSGLFWGLIHFIITFFIVLGLHLLYANIIFEIPGKHRFVGYVEILLGEKAKFLAFLNTIFNYYGSLLIYALLGGFFIFNIFPFFSSFYWSFIFLLTGSCFIFFNLQNTGKINFYLTLPLFFFILVFSFLLIPYIKISNFSLLNRISSNNWFLPYGVFIFSFSGFAVIPDIADFFKSTNGLNKKTSGFKKMKDTIKFSQIFIAVFYFIFIASVLGVLGPNTSENIFSDVSEIIGPNGFYIASFIGFLAVITSFIALAHDFKSILFLDYRVPLRISWFLIILPLIISLFFINQKFTAIISALGAIGLGVFGLFILLMAEKFKKHFSFKYKMSGVFWSPLISKFLIFSLILGASYEFFYIAKNILG